MTLRLIGVLAVAAWIPASAQNGLPRAAEDHADLSGVWTNNTVTPFERPRDLAGKEFFTEQEAAEYEKTHLFDVDKRDNITVTNRDVASAYNSFWWDPCTKVAKTRRTSIVIDPPDGRIPPLTAERQKQLQEMAEARWRRCEKPGSEPENSGQLGPADGPEDRPLMERCLSFGNAAPMVSSAYNNNYEIVQTPGFVGIDIEMVHQMRRIPIDETPHLPSHIREWVGDSRGHWEGDTLVVDTTNFNNLESFRGSDENLHLIERLTRIDADTVIYRFTIDDPTAFTRPWTGEIPFVNSDGLLYEYACHEGQRGDEGYSAAAASVAHQ
jgi:hypothetical protein